MVRFEPMWNAVVDGLGRVAAADPVYVASALALYIISLFLVGARWRGFVRALGGDVGVWRATLATLGGIAAGNVAPATRLGGEACRIALVRQSGTLTWRQATIAAAWDRLSEIPPIAVLAAMSAIALRRIIPTWRTGGLAIALAALLIGGAIAVRALKRSHRLSGWRESLSVDRVDATAFMTGVMFSSLMWLQDVLRLMCVTRAFGVSLPPTELAMLSMLAMLGGLVPGVAGMGPVEGTLMAGLLSFGVGAPIAIAVTAVERAISYGFSTAGGAIVITLAGGRSIWEKIRARSATSTPGTVAAPDPRPQE
jgi:uncharacterized membrane protein YbhN (UPF0104 family)